MKFLLFLTMATCAMAQSVPELASGLLRPTAGPTLEQTQFNFGALSLTATQPVRYLMVGGKPMGLVFGNASYAFEVTDPFSKPMVDRNMKSMDVSLTGIVNGCVVWLSDALPNVEGPVTGEPIPWLAKVIDNTLGSYPVHTVLQAKLSNQPGAVFAYLYMDKVKDRYLVYERNPLSTRMETLGMLDRYTFNSGYKHLKGSYFQYNLAFQPIDRQWWDTFTAPIVTTHLDLNVDNSKDDWVDVTTTSTLHVIKEGMAAWRVNLYTDFMSNTKLKYYKVQSVKVNGVDAEFVHLRDELLVKLDRAYKTNETLVVTVVSSGEIAVHEKGNLYWTLGTWAWYPKGNWNAEIAKLDLTVRTRKDYKIFGTGDTVSLEEVGDYKILKTKSDVPVQYPVVAAGKWYTTEQDLNGVKCIVGSLGSEKKSGNERLISNFNLGITYYGNMLGTKYPYKEMEILEIDTWSYLQAPPGVIFVAKWGYYFTGDVVLHEIAHTWWGLIVKKDTVEEQWLSESFAEYLSALCMEAAMEKMGRNGKAQFKSTLGIWEGNTRKIKQGGSIYLANYLAGYKEIDSDDRTWLLYSKGPLVIHALRMELQQKYGKDKGQVMFYTLLRSMVTNFKFKWGSTKHVVGILNQITQSDWQPWFEKYVYGTEIPEIK